jgi:thioredoxin 1
MVMSKKSRPDAFAEGAKAKRYTRAAVALCALALMVAAGCGGGAGARAVHIRDAQHFEDQVLEADKPVLVDFYKGGCPTCVALEPTFKKLSKEYEDRVVFASFELMKPYFAVTSAPVKEQYDIRFYPTVVLFVDGQEQERWALHYDIKDYRRSLDAALAGTAAAKADAGTVETQATVKMAAGSPKRAADEQCVMVDGEPCPFCVD